MEIRDPIHGPIRTSSAELRVIDSQPYQRLRSIKQLGFGELSFPGGTHNRYLHSLGAMHLAGRAFDAVMAERDLLPIPTAVEQQRLRQVLRLAALLHDVGHAPLSHATESALPTQDLLPLPYPTKNTTASHEARKTPTKATRRPSIAAVSSNRTVKTVGSLDCRTASK